MKLFLLSLVLCVGCMCFPRCCHRPNYYEDFLFKLQCKILLCKQMEKALSNVCMVCSPKGPPVNSTLKISNPQMLCQETAAPLGRLVITWSWLEKVDTPFLFMVEARSLAEGPWSIVGVTNVTFAEISNLDQHLEYQFRVTPLTTSASLTPLHSDWTNLTDMTKPLSAPTNISVSDFILHDSLVNATLKWTASKELPCSYKLFWLPSIGGDNFEQKTIVLPMDDLSAVLPGLLFETNYTITITPVSKRVEPSEAWFITPTCLMLTNSNFSLCAPGPPLNVSVYWKGQEAAVSWMPPSHASQGNRVSGYHISVFQSIMHYLDYQSVGKDSLNTTFLHLDPSVHYSFEVRAMSEGGTGRPDTAQLHPQVLSVLSPLPYHYIVPGLVVPLCIAIFVILHTLYSRKVSKKEGCAVADYMRPLLVPADKIQLQDVIGKGAFGVVHRGIYTRSKCKELVAVKVYLSETTSRRQLLQEVELMCIVGRHDKIVGLHGFTLDAEKMYLILEYCPLGDLHSYLVHLKPELLNMKSLMATERSITDRGHGKRLCSYIYQVAKGMEYVASLKLIHRDVAARNILMLNENRVKIGDFGLSKDVYETKIYLTKAQKRLPLKWMAPEAIEKQKFSTFTDVWSFGIFMWEVFKLGKEPYPGLQSSNLLQYLKMGYRLERPHCSQEWYKLMCLCWQIVPKERPCFKELVRQIGGIMDKMCLYVTISQ